MPHPTNPDSHAPIHTSPADTRTINERANFCFGCGPANPEGLHLSFTIDDHDTVNITATAIVTLQRVHEGPPGHIHGGIIATLFDEAMSKLNRPLNTLAMTRHMEVDYLRPAPLYVPLTLISRHDRCDGRKLFHTASLATADGRALATAKGFFLAIDQAVLASLSLPPA